MDEKERREKERERDIGREVSEVGGERRDK